MIMSEFPIYLVDDDDSVRRSVGFMLRTSRLEVHSYSDGSSFLKEVKQLEPGCVLLDIRMPRMDGLEVQAELAERGIAYPVVVMTGHGDVDVAVRAMKAGAVDFIEKPFDKQVMLEAVEEGFNRLDRSSENSQRQKEASVRLNALTPREYEVLEGLVKGYPNKTIGYDLGISARTVEIHRANVMKKLDVFNLSDLLRIAFSAGLGEREAES
jgi:two-component system, LuxR family, response regulator FixJ